MQFTYGGDEGRHYPTLGLTPEPGQRYELDADPADGRWEPADKATKAAAKDTTTTKGA